MFFFFLLLFSTTAWGIESPQFSTGWEKLSESSTLPSFSSDGFVGGVNVITGVLIEHCVDITTKGIDPQTLDRVFCRDQKHEEWDYDEPNFKGWYVCYDDSLFCQYEDILVSQKSGSYTHYQARSYDGDYTIGSFKGFMNASSGLLTGHSHCKNHKINGCIKGGEPRNFYLETGDGGSRCYEKRYEHGAHESHLEASEDRHTGIWNYSFVSEKKPSGNVVKYELINNKKTSLSTCGFSTYSADGKILLNTVLYGRQGDAYIADSSDKRRWTYQVNNGKKEYNQSITDVIRPDRQMIHYRYVIDSYRGVEYLIGKELPDGRFTKIEYIDPYAYRPRVMQISAPLGSGNKPILQYRFHYDKGFTDVFDGMNNQTRYEFDGESRFHHIIRFLGKNPYRYELSGWDSEGSLRAKTLHDADSHIFLSRKFDYDGKGNVVKETIYGDLTGTRPFKMRLDHQLIPVDEGQECYIKTFSYTNDRFNLLTSEQDHVASTHYTYYPQTNLLKSKLIKEGSHIRLRQFRAYDVCAALTLLIEDDGSSSDQDNLAGCTLRKITRVANRMSGNGVGQPELKEEKYYDFEKNREVLLKATRYSYDEHNDCIREDVYDSNNVFCYSIHRAYDAMGRCIKETDPVGNVVEKIFDANGNLVKQIGPLPGAVVENQYDLMNRLIVHTQRDDSGWSKTTRFRYDYAGNKILEIDEAGNETRYVYDSLGRVTEVIYPPTLDADDHQIVASIKKEYDIADNITRWTDEEGYTTETIYTARGLPSKRVSHGNEENFVYDLRGNLIQKIASDGGVTKFTYDFLDRIIQTEQLSPQGELFAKTKAKYTAFALIEAVDAEGALTQIDYDGAGRETAVCVGNTRVETSYSTLGFPAEIRRFFGDGDTDYTLTRLTHDFLGRVIQERVEDAAGNLYSQKRYAYNALGKCIESVEYLDKDTTATTFITYDSLGRVVGKQDAMGNRSTSQYIEGVERGSCQIDTDPIGTIKTSYFDARQRLVKEIVTNPADSTVSHKEFRYDGVGNRTAFREQQKPGIWQEVRFEYDGGGNMTEVLHPDKVTRTLMKYDLKGQLVEKINPLSQHSFFYDTTGKVILHRAIDGKEKIVTSYEYDKCGRTTLIEQNGQKTIRKYDLNGNITYEKQQSGHAVRYTYDRQGRRTSMHLPDGSSIGYQYAGPYLEKLVRTNAYGQPLYTHVYDKRDLRGKIRVATLAEKGGQVEIDYNLNGQIASINHPKWHQQASYDSCGNLSTLDTDDIRGKTTCAFAYDSLNQLTQENDLKCIYDGVGNKTDTHVGPCNQLEKCNGSDYSYDLEGRLKNSHDFTCSYDPLDRMVAYNKHTYAYDAFGRRIEKNGYFYLYDGNREIGLISPSGYLYEFRLLGEGLNNELSATLAVELNGWNYSTLSDVRGSPVCFLNPSGHPDETYRYSANGKATTVSNDASIISYSWIKNPWQFSSKRIDTESGWVFFGRRYYCPTLTRFTTPDPLGYKSSLNLYTFASNNPLTHSDLYGYYDPDGPLQTTSVIDFLCDIFQRCMSCIEWIGQNLIPLPGVRDIVEGIGRWGSGGKLLELPDYLKTECVEIRIPGIKVAGQTLALENGIYNSIEEAREAGLALSQKYGGVEVTVLYNSSHGIMTDILESLILKIGGVSPAEKIVIDFVKRTLQESPNETITIIAHSQAGLHLYNASKHLSREERDHIVAFTYGSTCLIRQGVFSECTNYVSALDIVPLTSIGFYTAAIGITDNVTFLKPNSYNPLKEHMFLETTYSKQLSEDGYLFQQRFL